MTSNQQARNDAICRSIEALRQGKPLGMTSLADWTTAVTVTTERVTFTLTDSADPIGVWSPRRNGFVPYTRVGQLQEHLLHGRHPDRDLTPTEIVSSRGWSAVEDGWCWEPDGRLRQHSRQHPWLPGVGQAMSRARRRGRVDVVH